MTGCMAALQRRLVSETPPRLLGFLVLIVAALALIGLIPYHTGRLGEIASLDNELHVRLPLWESRVNVPALVSAAILVVAGLQWWRVASLTGVRVVGGSMRVVAALFVFMAADETLALHERFSLVTGIRWQVVYAPVVLAAGLVAAVGLFRLVRAGCRAAAAWFAAGGVSWVFAQLLELAQFDENHVPVPGYWGYVWAEESLETLGSGLFVIAACSALATVQRRTTRAGHAG